MGAWGVGIFADDDAADVRDGYKDLVAQGLSGPEATQRLLQECKDDLSSEAASSFWLALAATQHACGRLEDRVKQMALEVIDSGSDLLRWKDNLPALLTRRKSVLQKLRTKLLSPQPAPKPIRGRFIENIQWERGHVISYRLKRGDYALLRVLGVFGDRGGSYPIVELCDWSGESVPEPTDMEQLPYKRFIKEGEPLTQFMLARRKENELPAERVKVVATGSRLERPAFKSVGYSNIIYWKELDGVIEGALGGGDRKRMD
jgi:hypothetical protein